MITRILRKEEQWKSDRIQAVCFEIPFDTEKAKKQSQESVQMEVPSQDTIKTGNGISISGETGITNRRAF